MTAAPEGPLVLDASLTVAEARGRLAGIPEWEYVAVRRLVGAQVYWYIFEVGMILARAATRPEEADLVAGLDLHEWESVPAVQAEDAHMHEGPFVVLDGDEVIGIEPRAMPATAAPPEEVGGGAPGGEVGGGAPGAGPGAGAQPRQVRFSAYPDLRAPEQVRVDEWFDLTIGFSTKPVEGVQGRELVIHVPDEVRDLPIQVQVIADGFETRPGGGWRFAMLVDRQNPTAAKVVVPLRATEAAADRSSLRVHYFYKGEPCGQAYRNVTVVRHGKEAPPQQPPEAITGGTLVLSEVAEPADLTLTICSPEADGFKCLITTCHDSLKLPDLPYPVRLRNFTDAPAFAAHVAQSVQADLGSPLIRSTLEGLGKMVAKCLPPEAWQSIRLACDHVEQKLGRAPTLLIKSEEHHIPWELAYFERHPERPPHLGAQIAIGRWYQPYDTDQPSPDGEIPIQRLAVVWSEYKGVMGQQELPHAREEAEFLKREFMATPLPARNPEVYALVNDSSLSAQVLHFACHGATYPLAPGSAELVLESGPPNLKPVNICGSRGVIDRDRPFVFLNACQVGQAVDLLASNMGFTGAFLEGGCRACVAPLWNVVDETARTLVEAFYQQTLSHGQTVGAVLRDLRARFLAGEGAVPDPTWLAYAYYGHPNLKLKKVT